MKTFARGRVTTARGGGESRPSCSGKIACQRERRRFAGGEALSERGASSPPPPPPPVFPPDPSWRRASTRALSLERREMDARMPSFADDDDGDGVGGGDARPRPANASPPSSARPQTQPHRAVVVNLAAHCEDIAAAKASRNGRALPGRPSSRAITPASLGRPPPRGIATRTTPRTTPPRPPPPSAFARRGVTPLDARLPHSAPHLLHRAVTPPWTRWQVQPRLLEYSPQRLTPSGGSLARLDNLGATVFASCRLPRADRAVVVVDRAPAPHRSRHPPRASASFRRHLRHRVPRIPRQHGRHHHPRPRSLRQPPRAAMVGHAIGIRAPALFAPRGGRLLHASLRNHPRSPGAFARRWASARRCRRGDGRERRRGSPRAETGASRVSSPAQSRARALPLASRRERTRRRRRACPTARR